MNVKIEKIAIASFGKLKMVTVTPSEGINILSAPNESGKSTLAAFIKFIFYGFSGSRKSLSENERKLYTPWDGEVSEGALAITADGVRYDIYRKCLASGKENVEVINRSTGKSEFKGEVPGEVFFGVGEEVFARTLFFRQLTVPQNKDEILAERLRNIAIGADEEVGTEKALHRLNEAKKEIKSRVGGGILPKLETERDRLEALITDGTDARKEAVRLRTDINNRVSKIESGAEKLESLEKERKNIEKYESLQKLQMIKALADEESKAKADFETASASLKNGGADLSLLNSKNTELLVERKNNASLASELKLAEDELENRKDETEAIPEVKKKSNKLFLIPLAAGLASGVAGGLFFALSRVVPAALLLVVLAVCSVIAVLLYKKSKKESNRLKNERDVRLFSEEQRKKEILLRIESRRDALSKSSEKISRLNDEIFEMISESIDVPRSDDYTRSIENLRLAVTDLEKKKFVWDTKRAELLRMTENIDIEALAESAKGATLPERDRSAVDRELKFYGQQQDLLVEQVRRDELTCTAIEAKLGDVATLVGKRDALDARISDLAIKHSAYETAMRVIGEAADHMKGMIAPRIGARASKYFSSATGGKYSSFDVDTSLSMSFGEDFRRSCDYLSAGTRDSAYLSLRLALADILFGGCGVPILLDDAFVRMDEERLRNMANALKEASEKHQIFILTHGDREINAFAEQDIEINEITFKSER